MITITLVAVLTYVLYAFGVTEFDSDTFIFMALCCVGDILIFKKGR